MTYVKAPAPKPRFYRTTLTFPQAMAVDISAIAKRLQMSQSSLLTLLLEEPLQQLARLVALMPSDVLSTDRPDPDVVRRLSGQSVEDLRAAVTSALEAARALDPGFEL